jgi:hypothetical protein
MRGRERQASSDPAVRGGLMRPFESCGGIGCGMKLGSVEPDVLERLAVQGVEFGEVHSGTKPTQRPGMHRPGDRFGPDQKSRHGTGAGNGLGSAAVLLPKGLAAATRFP